MSAFLPSNVTSFWIAGAIVVASLLAAYAATCLSATRLAVLFAWMVPVAVVAFIELFLADEPPGFRMLVIILGVLFGMKGVVSVESQRQGGPRLRPIAWFSFAAGWPGMRPVAFANVPGPRRRDALQYITRGIVSLLAGLAFGVVAHWTSTSNQFSNTAARQILVFLFLLPGVSLILHFGIFSILAGVWRLFGADCRPLFRDPLRSKSLAEFWSRRWNLAFSEMTAIALFRPLRERLGKGAASFAAFVFSGLLHELAISLPVHADYGLPMLYFLLQGTAVAWEQRLARHGRPIDARPWFGRCWSIAWLVLPLPILFHPPFLKGILLPLIGG